MQKCTVIWNGDTHDHSSQLRKNVQWFGTAIHISSLDCWGQQICSQFGSTNTATTQTGTATICKMSAPAAPADVSLMTAEDGIFEVFLLVQLQLLIGWQINNAKRSVIIISSGSGVVSASSPQVLLGISSTWETHDENHKRENENVRK